MFNRIKKVLRTDREIEKRIKRRHYAFWRDPEREVIHHDFLDSSAPSEVWKGGENWQRRLSNKYNSREFAKKHGCKVPELYWRGRNVGEIDFKKLPDHYVLKPTLGHACKGALLMSKGKNLFDNKFYSNQKLIEAMDQVLNRTPNAEYEVLEFIRTENGEYEIPVDYKVFAFNGHIACINVINRIRPGKGTQRFYDENWKELKPIVYCFPILGHLQPPECLPEMLDQAKKLSKEYMNFVRVDFYASDKGPVFGEFAPTPAMGTRYSSYGSDLLVSHWDKYCTGLI